MTPVPLTIDELEHWRLFGADWRVLEITDMHAEVEFCACTGEPVERRGTSQPEVIRYLRDASGGDSVSG
jgi:hypothetical protein